MSLLNLLTRTQISEALGRTLIHFLWEGLIVVAIFAPILALTRSPRIRYLAGCTALVAMFASFTFTLIHFLPEPRGNAETLIRITLPPWSPQPDANGNGSHFLNFGRWVPWLAPVWMVGVCIFYLRYSAGWLSLYGIRRRAVCNAPVCWQRFVTRMAVELKVSRPLMLLESLLADTPVVLGHFRPVILVPLGFLSCLSPGQVEAILLHELAHIRRSDYLVNICQRLIEGLLFYHPAVWWISSVIRTERENCCDDVVVTLTGNAHNYAVALTAVEQNRLERGWRTREPAVAATGGNLMKRIKRLLYPKGPSGMWAPALAALILMASTTMILAAAWHVNSGSNRTSQETRQTVANPWQKWLSEDMIYIISDEEKTTFEHLKTDEERQQFVEQFWARRDPTPGTPENEFKEEHYRRIAYANKHWGGNLPGWKTDRGRIYIRYGPPDEIDSHPSGGNYQRPESEGGGPAMTHPFEDWRYSHFEDIGSLSIEFVDLKSTGEFRMTLNPNEKYEKP